MLLRRLTAAVGCWIAVSTVNVCAQSGAKIEVVSIFVARPASDMPLPIRIGPPEAVPKNAFVRIRGIPMRVTLSEGYQVAAGVWALPLNGLAALSLILPKEASGRSDLQISLLSIDGVILAEAKTSLLIAQINIGPEVAQAPAADAGPKPLAPIAPPVLAGRPNTVVRGDLSAGLAARVVEPPRPAAPPILPPARPPPLSDEQRLRFERLVDQGDKVLALGNVAASRQFYLRAAEAGYAVAATRLARTYDPIELARLAVRGLAGDEAEARRWYQRASELGDAVATEALARLNRSP
jgi:hypothetical protein